MEIEPFKGLTDNEMEMRKQETDPLPTDKLSDNLVNGILRPCWSVDPMVRLSANEFNIIVSKELTDTSFERK